MRAARHLTACLVCCALTGPQMVRQAPAQAVGIGPDPVLPKPTQSLIKHARVIGWPEGRTPIAPPRFKVTAYARGLDGPRWLHVLPNGDVLVTDARAVLKPGGPAAARDPWVISGSAGISANRITLLRDADHDGVPEMRTVLIENLTQPFGMALVGDALFVANTSGLLRFPYQTGQTRIAARGELILSLAAGGTNNHWTRNVIAARDGRKLYVSVGSSSDFGEHGMAAEARRANILEINPDGSGERIFASGLRNPVGLAWEPVTGALWTAVPERDGLGDDLPPDYITSVRENGFYGWPYAYFGKHEDPRVKPTRPDLVANAIAPDFAVGAHTVPLGLLFYTGGSFPERYSGGAFVAQRGSWNRSSFAGYKVLFIPFRNGKPAGPPEDFLTGFIANAQTSEVFGRPVGLALLPDGSLLVTDDAANMIWRVQAVR